MSTRESLPVGTPVILKDLVTGAEYNGKLGVVKSAINNTSGRLNVYVKDLNKTIAIKPTNLKVDLETYAEQHNLHTKLKEKNKSDGIPTWYREQITPNDGNQFMVSGDVNRKRKPFPENNNKYKNGTYWQGGGKYQQLFDKLVNSLPPSGKSSTKAGEIARAANKLLYDLYNNGMMNNNSSALVFLARQGVFPTSGGDKVFATIYPYSLGPMGNTQYTGDFGNYGRGDDLTKSIEKMVDRSMEFIVDNPHLETESNHDDMMFGIQMIQLATQLMRGNQEYGDDIGEGVSGFWRHNLRKIMKEGDEDPEFWYNGLIKLQIAMEGDDNGGCTHGRTPVNILEKDGFEFVDYCENEWEDTEPTLPNFKKFTTSMNQFSDLLKDACKMKLVNSYLKASATSLYLEGNIDMAAGIVSCIIALEDLTVFNESKMKELVVDEAGDRCERIATFLAAQIPCSCLVKRSKPRALCQYCKNDRRQYLLQCSGCSAVFYCSKQCQQKDWRDHKKTCRRNASHNV